MPEHHKPLGRPFPWVCPKCHKKEVQPALIPYHAERLHEGRIIAVDIPRLEVPRCGNCGELVFNYAADEQIPDAVKAQASVSGIASISNEAQANLPVKKIK
jgi:hypothetical protein